MHSLSSKPVLLFSSPSTSLTNQTKPLPPNLVDPSQLTTSLNSDSEPSFLENTYITATFTTKTPPAPAKTCMLNKQTRKFPRTTKQPLPTPKDKPTHTIHSQIINTPQQVSRKRLNTIGLASASKKGHGATFEIEDPPETLPVFNLGFTKKASARAIFKAARKGKNKMVS